MTRVPDNAARPEAGSLPALLAAIPERIPIAAIDELWIFPPHRVGQAESLVVVVAAFDDGDDRRRIFTARCTVVPEKQGTLNVQPDLTEQGSAPADRLGRLIDGVLRRLSDELPAAPPRQVRIGGETARWQALLSAADALGSGPP